ncbi:MAG: hypothetical protein M1839_008049 [Geoglossum umbratile]|nr:MAG: hypothetical protein M1839_008049 [Geoglossum umbratile]
MENATSTRATSKRKGIVNRISKFLRTQKEKPVKQLEPPVPYVPQHAASSFLKTATPLPLSQRHRAHPMSAPTSLEQADEAREHGLRHANIATSAQLPPDELPAASSTTTSSPPQQDPIPKATKTLSVTTSQDGAPEAPEAPLPNRDSGFVDGPDTPVKLLGGDELAAKTNSQYTNLAVIPTSRSWEKGTRSGLSADESRPHGGLLEGDN